MFHSFPKYSIEKLSAVDSKEKLHEVFIRRTFKIRSPNFKRAKTEEVESVPIATSQNLPVETSSKDPQKLLQFEKKFGYLKRKYKNMNLLAESREQSIFNQKLTLRQIFAVKSKTNDQSKDHKQTERENFQKGCTEISKKIDGILDFVKKQKASLDPSFYTQTNEQAARKIQIGKGEVIKKTLLERKNINQKLFSKPVKVITIREKQVHEETNPRNSASLDPDHKIPTVNHRQAKRTLTRSRASFSSYRSVDVAPDEMEPRISAN